MADRYLMTVLLSLLLIVAKCAKIPEIKTQAIPATVIVLYDADSETFNLHHGDMLDGYVARAQFLDMRKDYGLTFLTVNTNESYPDYMQAYAAGLAEGHVTQPIIAQHWNNTVAGYCTPDASSPYCQRLAKYINTNYNEFIPKNIRLLKGDPYWHQVELYLQQLNGLTDGYHGTPGNPRIEVEPFGMLMFQISGDLEDLEVALNKPEKLRKHVLGSGSCSALVKLLPGNKELFVAQDTWTTYQSMLRIVKRYLFSYHHTANTSSGLIPGNEVLFSSYPGSLFSGDDYYMTGSGLTIMETTIGNSNPDLVKFIQPESTVLESLRNVVANRLARDGSTWADIFSLYNSGTYNNEWMIVDYNKFTPGMKDLPESLLVVLEQLPGMIVWDDMTSVLANQTYWASYNSPYFKEIFNASGAQKMVDRYGDWFTYENTPRAKIFRRDHHKVVDMDSLMKLMRYNDYKNDEFSKCNCTPPYSAENAISARSDLNPANGTYPFSALGHRSHGGIDMKMMIVSGPTHQDQPPFSWLTADFADTTPHEGQPDTFDFKSVVTNW